MLVGVMRTIMFSVLIAGTSAQRVRAEASPESTSRDGCDEARWSQWRAIVNEAEGWPDERQDARSVMAANRRICSDWKAGRISEEEADRLYRAEVKAWSERIRKRAMDRELREAGSGSG